MFRIASSQFGYMMFAAPSVNPAWSDRIDEAEVYGPQDDRATKLAYWRGYASGVCGLDPNSVQIVEAA